MTTTTKPTTPHSHITRISSIHGHPDAVEALTLITQLITTKNIVNAILLVGPPGSGKTALATALSAELSQPNNCDSMFVCMSGSEVYSSEIKKTEVLAEYLRMAMRVRIREVKDIFEGEVTSIQITENNQKMKSVVLTLKTAKASKCVTLSPSIWAALESERVTVGDVVYIESNSGIIKRLGRSESHAENNLDAEHYVPLPKTGVHRKREVQHDISLYDLDRANTSRLGDMKLVGAVREIVNSKRNEVTESLRGRVDGLVDMYCGQGDCEMYNGVLFIDEAYMLDEECFAYLGREMEKKNCPLIVLSTNKTNKTNKINGDSEGNKILHNSKSCFGIPSDFLNRLLIVCVQKNTIENISKIIASRIQYENVAIESEAYDALIEIADKYGLRYAMGLLPILKSMGESVSVDDVKEAHDLFQPI